MNNVYEIDVSHNMDTYDSFQLLKNNIKFDVVLIDEDISDYTFNNIVSVARDCDGSISIVILISGNMRSINYFGNLMNKNLIKVLR